jgi:tape measure domain-containing protein
VQENILIKVGADISDFSRKIKKVSDAGTVFKDLDGRWRNAQGQFVKMSDQSKKLGGALSSAASKAKSFASSVTSIASGIGVYAAVSKGIGMISNALDGAISRYDTLNNFPRVMQQIGFSADDSEKAISKLSDGIQGLPTTLDDVASTAQRIAVMTGDLDGAVDTTLALNNAFIASGSDAANAARGLEQYVQMLSRGEVGLEEWRTLQETMGVALNDVAKAFGFAGKSAQNDLYDALKSGEITMEEFNAKLIELNDGTNGFAERALTASGGIRTAWTNMQTSIVRGVTKIIEAIDSVLANTPLESIENIINNIGNAFFNFLDGIAQKIPIAVGFVSQLFSVFKDGGLPAVFQLLTETAQGSIDSILGIITSNLPTLLENGRQMLLSLIQGIIDTIPQLLPVVTKIVTTLVNTIASYFPKFLEAGTQVLLKIVDGIMQMLPDIVSAATDIIENLVVTLINNLPKIISTGVKLLLSLVDGISNALPRLVSASVNLITNITATLVANLPRIIVAGTKILISLITGILKLIPRLLSTGVKIVGEFSRSIIGAVPKMVKAGADLIKGLWNGINSVKDWILGKISGFVDGIVGGIKKFFGIASPSKVLRDEVGRWIPAGLVDGINSEKNDVIKAAEQMAQWATPDVPDVAIAYSTPSGLRSSLSSAVSGTVDVNTRDDMLAAAINRLEQSLDGMTIVMDGERVGQLVRPHVNEGNAVDALVRRYFD